MIKKPALLLASLLLVGCSSSPAATSYILGSSSAPGSPVVKPIGVNRIGVDSVRVPSYAQSKEIAMLNSDNTLTTDDNHLWAEAPEETIQRMISQGLRQTTGLEVIASPYPRGMDADARVQVRFDHLVQTETIAKISGQFIITDGRGREVVKIEDFDYSRPLNGASYSGFVDTVNDAIAQLIGDIAAGASN